MRLKTLHLRNFKRFTDLQVVGLPATARLIVLAGPNGSGKSSVFDGLKTWHWYNGSPGAWDETYGAKVGTPSMGWTEHATVEFHEARPSGPDELKKLVYVRSAFRNEADFQFSQFSRLASPLDSPRVNRMIDTDASVSDNYQRLIMDTIDGIYNPDLPDTMTRIELRDRVIGKVRSAMEGVFPDLVLDGVGGMGGATETLGTFYFSKGTSKHFLYKNLSAGEKASFDLILDAVIKSSFYDDSLWCIDEPETHLNTRIQASLLDTLLGLLPPHSQMILATHSIGFMRKAWEMAKQTPGSVVFLDMQDQDFDTSVTLSPMPPSRAFWERTLNVALGDLAHLMAPERIVLCEGRPTKGAGDRKGEFDASCYRRIFAGEFPETDFLSVGNNHNVQDDHLEAGRAIQTIASGTQIVRVIDRDLLNDAEVQAREALGVRVLSRRNLEAFLVDDEVLAALCRRVEQPDKVFNALAAKADALAASVSRGNDSDDYKKTADELYLALRKLLDLTSAGSDWTAFARETLSPLIRPGMTVYDELKRDIFEMAVAS